MKLNTSLNLRPLLGKLRANVTIVFWILLIALILLEAWVLKKSYDKVRVAKEEVQISVSRQVRINDEAYNKAIKRVETGNTYQPQPALESAPFGVIDLTQKEQPTQ
jgi:hypothetical protein